MATKRLHFEAPKLDDIDADLLPLAKKLIYVQSKALIVYANALRIWGVTYAEFKKKPYELLNAFHHGYRQIPKDAEETPEMPTLKMEVEVLKVLFWPFLDSRSISVRADSKPSVSRRTWFSCQTEKRDRNVSRRDGIRKIFEPSVGGA